MSLDNHQNERLTLANVIKYTHARMNAKDRVYKMRVCPDSRDASKDYWISEKDVPELLASGQLVIDMTNSTVGNTVYIPVSIPRNTEKNTLAPTIEDKEIIGYDVYMAAFIGKEQVAKINIIFVTNSQQAESTIERLTADSFMSSAVFPLKEAIREFYLEPDIVFMKEPVFKD